MTTNLSRPSAPRPAFVDVPARGISSRASNRPPRVPARFLDSPRASRDHAAELIRTSSRRRAAPRRARSRVSVVDRAARRRASAAVASRASRASSSSRRARDRVARCVGATTARGDRPAPLDGAVDESRRVLNRRVCVCFMFFVHGSFGSLNMKYWTSRGGADAGGGARSRARVMHQRAPRRATRTAATNTRRRANADPESSSRRAVKATVRNPPAQKASTR